MILQILRNPIVKAIGIGLIFYFALFANKQSPKSLGNRLSPENVKKELEVAKDKGQFIVTNVKIAKNLAENKELQSQLAKSPATTISFDDLEIGTGDLMLACGDEAEISYGIYTANSQQMDFVDSERLVIGANTKTFLEKNLIGMKLSGIRNITIPRGSQINDLKIMQFLNRSGTDLKIQVTLLALTKTTTPNPSCN